MLCSPIVLEWIAPVNCMYAYDVTFRHTANMRLLDALIRRKLPVGPDAQDADAPDAYYLENA